MTTKPRPMCRVSELERRRRDRLGRGKLSWETSSPSNPRAVQVSDLNKLNVYFVLTLEVGEGVVNLCDLILAQTKSVGRVPLKLNP